TCDFLWNTEYGNAGGYGNFYRKLKKNPKTDLIFNKSELNPVNCNQNAYLSFEKDRYILIKKSV
ncbi:hypothetical protein, partial [Pedobacter hiemivivus]